MVFHGSLSDSKNPQVSRTFLSIMGALKNAVVWIVSTRPPTSKSSSPFNNPFFTVPEAPITIGIIFAFMFHSFFRFFSKVEVLILLFTFFQFYSVVNRDRKVHNFADSPFFYWLVLDMVLWPRFGNPSGGKSLIAIHLCHFLGHLLCCAYTIYSYGQI